MDLARVLLSVILLMFLFLGGYELANVAKKKTTKWLGVFMLICGGMLMSAITCKAFIN